MSLILAGEPRTRRHGLHHRPATLLQPIALFGGVVHSPAPRLPALQGPWSEAPRHHGREQPRRRHGEFFFL